MPCAESQPCLRNLHLALALGCPFGKSSRCWALPEQAPITGVCAPGLQPRLAVRSPAPVHEYGAGVPSLKGRFEANRRAGVKQRSHLGRTIKRRTPGRAYPS